MTLLAFTVTPPNWADEPFTEVIVDAKTLTGTVTLGLETVHLDPLDADPSDPAERQFEIDAPFDKGYFRVAWRYPGSNPTERSSWFLVGDVSAVGTYLTSAQLLADPGIPDSLDQDRVDSLLNDAEDLVDSLLGHGPVHAATGRRVDVDDPELAPWQIDKLRRATLKVAVRLYADPKLALGRQWQTETGPDFSVSGPISGSDGDRTFGADVLALLKQAGFRDRLWHPQWC